MSPKTGFPVLSLFTRIQPLLGLAFSENAGEKKKMQVDPKAGQF
jgi:hypothetical protein